MKDEFLNNEIWVLTFQGGFQRANIYKEKVSEKVKKVFREQLRAYIEALVEIKYITEVTEEEHIKNIKGIVKLSNINTIQGKSIPINFGVAQKLLNLYLKYSWCSGRIDTVPVHFPVDRLIQDRLNEEAKQIGIPGIELKPWTRFEDEEDYMKVIKLAKKIKANKYANDKKTLAEMELEIFRRR